MKDVAQRSTEPKRKKTSQAYVKRSNTPTARFTFFPRAMVKKQTLKKQKLSNSTARAAHYKRATDKVHVHDKMIQFLDHDKNVDDNEKIKNNIIPTWDMAAAEVFSSSCSGSDLSWNNDSKKYDSRADFYPKNFTGAVFCRDHTPPPPEHKQSLSASDLWAEPMPSYMLPTPPTHTTTHSTHISLSAQSPITYIHTHPKPEYTRHT